MPKALERKLRLQANKHKDWSEERKDKYVYGALRDTGWKPSHQKKKSKQMSDPDDRIIQLQAINKHLDDLIQFQYDDDDYDTKNRRFLGKAAVGAGAATGLGAAGLYAAGARAQGVPYGAIPKKIGQNIMGIGRGGAGDFAAAVRQGYQKVVPGLKGIYGSATSKIAGLLKRFKFDSKTKTIEFANPNAGMFGQYDPGIIRRLRAGTAKASALHTLRMKIRTLRPMGLSR